MEMFEAKEVVDEGEKGRSEEGEAEEKGKRGRGKWQAAPVERSREPGPGLASAVGSLVPVIAGKRYLMGILASLNLTSILSVLPTPFTTKTYLVSFGLSGG